jgi:hypothetical protein
MIYFNTKRHFRQFYAAIAHQSFHALQSADLCLHLNTVNCYYVSLLFIQKYVNYMGWAGYLVIFNNRPDTRY